MRSSTSLRIVSLLALSALAGCSNSSGGGSALAIVQESEPNDDSATANGLVVGENGSGLVADSTDHDFWSVDLAANELISIEVFAQRFDQDTWGAAGNGAKITVYDTDGTTALLTQDDESFDWNGDQDTDIDVFRAPAAGTYFLAIDVADALNTGGDYVVRVENVTLPTPLQFEQELEGVTGTNDSDATAEAITPGTVFGFHVDDESDFYSFDVTEPSLLTFEMHGHKNGVWKSDSYYDPELFLFDPTVTQLFANDDTFYLDSAIEYVVTTPGTYFISVAECCADGDSGYSLEFGMTALADMNVVSEVEGNDTIGAAQVIQFGDYVTGNASGADDDFFAIACSAGDRIQLQLFDNSNSEAAVDSVDVDILDSLSTSLSSASGSVLQITRTILTDTGTFYLQFNASAGATDYAFIVTQDGAAFEAEPNDLVADAGTFVSGKAAGTTDPAGESDLFQFTATAGVPVIFTCLASSSNTPNGFFEVDDFGSSMKPKLEVIDAASTVLAASDANFGTAVGTLRGLDSVTLAFVPATSGTFYLQVTDSDGTGSAFHYYKLSMD